MVDEYSADLGKSWGEALNLWPQALKRAWPWIASFIIIEEALSYEIGLLREMDDRFLIFGMLFTLGLQLLLSAVGITIVNGILKDTKNNLRTSVLQTLKDNFKFVLIESTRALLPVMVRLVMFIVPGLIESVRLYFIPYIVQFDPLYKTGQIDALEQSRKLTRGRLVWALGILILTFALSMIPRFGLYSVSLLKTPAVYALMIALSVSLELYGDIVLFCTYERLAKTMR